MNALMIPSQQHLEECLNHWGQRAGRVDTQPDHHRGAETTQVGIRTSHQGP